MYMYVYIYMHIYIYVYIYIYDSFPLRLRNHYHERSQRGWADNLGASVLVGSDTVTVFVVN